MAASDPDVAAAKARLDKGAQEPLLGYITPSDVKTSFDDLQTGWGADVAEHSAAADPHTQYLQDAPSNGNQYARQNGSWAVVLGGGGSPTNNNVTITDSDATYLTRTDIQDDGTDTATWPNRFDFWFEQGQGSGTFYPTGWFNEFGEIRAASATASTVAMRAHGHQGDDSTGDIFQVRNERGGSVNMLRVARTEAEFQVPLTVPSPTAGGHAATRDYVDSAVAGSGPTPTEDFEGGVDTNTITTTATIVSVTGSPAYTSSSISGSLSARILNGEWIEFNLVKNGNVFTASAKARVDQSIASSAIRGMLLVDAGGSWISYLRFSSGGSIEVTDGTTFNQTGPAWSVGTVYRVEAVCDSSGDITWQVFDSGGTSLWTSTPITPTDTDPPTILRLGGAGGPSNADTVWDDVVLDDTGTFTYTLRPAVKDYVDGRIWSGSQAAYDALTPDPDVLYVIV